MQPLWNLWVQGSTLYLSPTSHSCRQIEHESSILLFAPISLSINPFNSVEVAPLYLLLFARILLTKSLSPSLSELDDSSSR